MLVYGGVMSVEGDVFGDNITTCDDGVFDRGLGLFHLHNHTWSTNFEPPVEQEEHELDSMIVEVIGGR